MNFNKSSTCQVETPSASLQQQYPWSIHAEEFEPQWFSFQGRRLMFAWEDQHNPESHEPEACQYQFQSSEGSWIPNGKHDYLRVNYVRLSQSRYLWNLSRTFCEGVPRMLWILWIISNSFFPGKSGIRVSISNITQPAPQISILGQIKTRLSYNTTFWS